MRMFPTSQEAVEEDSVRGVRCGVLSNLILLMISKKIVRTLTEESLSPLWEEEEADPTPTIKASTLTMKDQSVPMMDPRLMHLSLINMEEEKRDPEEEEEASHLLVETLNPIRTKAEDPEHHSETLLTPFHLKAEEEDSQALPPQMTMFQLSRWTILTETWMISPTKMLRTMWSKRIKMLTRMRIYP